MSTNLNPLGFIKTNSLSYTEIQNDLLEFINALSEEEKLGFKTLFEGDNSKILLEVLAAKSSDELYHIINSRNENLMFYANRQDSAIAIAQNDAYSVFRGSNIKLKITIRPNNAYTLSKLSIIGTAGDSHNIIVTDNTNLERNKPVEVFVTVGTIKEETLISDTNGLALFRFTNKNISNDVALYLDGTEAGNLVPMSTNILDMINDSYFCMTNAYNGLDVLYLNTRDGANYKYQNGSTLTLKYVELENISVDSLEILSNYGEITSIEQVSSYLEPESLASIRHKAALYAETQNRIVARDDFQKVMLDSYPMLSDANGKDFSNAQVQITYAKKDGELLTTEEYNMIFNDLSGRRGFGIPMCKLIAPEILNNLTLSVFIQLQYSPDVDIAECINKILDNYKNKLGITINFEDIEHQVESLDFVKIARVRLYATDYTQGNSVYEGMTLKSNPDTGYAYVIKKILAKTGTTQPTWPTTVGNTVVDNKIIWTCEAKSNEISSTWAANTAKELGDLVVPTASSNYQYRCTGFNYKTGATEPTWPTELDDVVIDNEILWRAIKKEVVETTWSASTVIERGTIVQSTADSDFSYQAIDYATTLPAEPIWPEENAEFVDGLIEYIVIKNDVNITDSNAFAITLDWNQYCSFAINIEVA